MLLFWRVPGIEELEGEGGGASLSKYIIFSYSVCVDEFVASVSAKCLSGTVQSCFFGLFEWSLSGGYGLEIFLTLRSNSVAICCHFTLILILCSNPNRQRRRKSQSVVGGG